MFNESEKRQLFEQIGEIKGIVGSLPCKDHANRIDRIRSDLNNHKVCIAKETGNTKLELIKNGLVFVNALGIIALTLIIVFKNFIK
jgi:hypothetical protein